jgi:hypothetical protein
MLRKLAMNVRCALVVTTTALLVAPAARGGHEQPVYPSYYPHEIEIATVEPQQAAGLLRAGKLHAYAGAPPELDGPPPDGIGSVQSLGAFLVVRVRPGSLLAQDESAACGLVASLVRALSAKGGNTAAHPYPVTPLHGDYLLHADLAEAALARLSGVAEAGGGLKVRAEGALAQSLVRPAWRTDGADWDAAVEEVDAGRLVASDTALLNGWMGPRWARSGWFQAYRLLADTITDPEARRGVQADAVRLQSGDITDPAERANLERDLVRRLTTGCGGAVAGYTVKREAFNASFSEGIENIASDTLEGFTSPMFLRSVKLKDFPWNGWLKLGTGSAPKAAWNPVGGFTDDFGRLMWFAIGDPAVIPSPYDNGWVLNRISEVEATPR